MEGASGGSFNRDMVDRTLSGLAKRHFYVHDVHADGPAVIDYSFVTGESEPVEKKPGDYLYAGGRQIGGAITIERV